jgi:hypothetical protein
MAASQGHTEFVHLLLRLHPHLAQLVTVSKPRDIARFLFERGMDPNRPDWMRKTPLHHFASSGDVESAALFIEHGADVHARDEEHCSTPLAIAAMHGQVRMVEFLLRHGASPELDDDPPWARPVEWAKRRGQTDIVRILENFARAGPPAGHSLDTWEALAQDFVDACVAGNERALHNIRDHFRIARKLNWDHAPLDVQLDRLRSFVREYIETLHLAEAEHGTLTLPLARLLVARSEGFESWADLTKAAARPAEPGP